ncbi:lecithin retinol acyltransferase family protein [Pseudomonas sp. 3HC3]|uniref:lecithin retinol acyltransferase family protein n=1 Tax=Pseudomonas sp. 3HC3 TaxID=2781025 RepID=UPI003847D114
MSFASLEIEDVPENEWWEWDYITGAEVAVGSHLITARNGYYHHGIYLGAYQVVHYSGLCSGLHPGPVEIIELKRFSLGSPVWIHTGLRFSFQQEEVVRRALSRVGENQYRLLTNNCEHFCNWCLHGESRSDQVRNFVTHPFAALRLLLLALPGLFQRAATV